MHQNAVNVFAKTKGILMSTSGIKCGCSVQPVRGAQSSAVPVIARFMQHSHVGMLVTCETQCAPKASEVLISSCKPDPCPPLVPEPCDPCAKKKTPCKRCLNDFYS